VQIENDFRRFHPDRSAAESEMKSAMENTGVAASLMIVLFCTVSSLFHSLRPQPPLKTSVSCTRNAMRLL